MAQVLRRSVRPAGRNAVYGNGPPPLPASAPVTAASSAPIADAVATAMDRTLLNRRLDMPGSFRCQGQTPPRTVS